MFDKVMSFLIIVYGSIIIYGEAHINYKQQHWFMFSLCVILLIGFLHYCYTVVKRWIKK